MIHLYKETPVMIKGLSEIKDPFKNKTFLLCKKKVSLLEVNLLVCTMACSPMAFDP